MKNNTGRALSVTGRKGSVAKSWAVATPLLRRSLMLGMLCAFALGVRAATLVQEFYLPMPEQQIYTADSAIETGVGTTFDSIFSVVITGSGTVVYYDQWEDGYETDLANPTQSSTLVWGDGNDVNGIAPGFAHDPNGLAAGTVLALRNNVSLPRNPSTILYDGRDRVAGTKALVITRAAWPTAQGSVFAGSASVYSTINYGTNFICPVGQDITNRLFGYVGMFVMAGSDNTSVTIDPDGAGTNVATTVSLNKGESYLVNGNVRKGATITATKGVQVHAIIGHIAGRYASDWFNLTPVSDWDDTYYTPVPTSASGNPAYVYLYNPSTNAITINTTTRTGPGSFSIPATNTYQYTMPQASGVKFISSGGQRYFALCTVAANNASDTAFNWGFTLVPKAALTTELVVGWGPGSSDGTANGSPAWVTPIANTTIYVDYNGDRVGTNSINGQPYDASYSVVALESKKVFDPDKDQTAMRIFTVDGTLITGAWGEDADTAAAGNPYIDAGTTILPFPVPVLFKSVTNLIDNAPTGLSTNDVLQYTVQLDNRGLLPLGNTVVIDAPSANLQYVSNTTTLNGSPISDNPGPYTTNNTAFPLDAFGSQGYTVPVILRDGTSVFKYQVRVIAPGSVSNSVNVAGTTLSAQTTVAPSSVTPTSCALSFSDSGGTVQSAYTVGGAGVYVTLTDADENTSSNTTQIASVVVRNVARNDLETITLTETGTNTGIFRNASALPISTSTGLSQGDGTLYVVPGDTLTVTNFDVSNGDSCNTSASVLAPASGKVLYLSNPGQALDRIDPVATADGTTATSTDIGSSSGSSTIPGLVSVKTTNTTASVAALTLNSVVGISTTNRMLLVALAFNPSGATGCTNITFGPQTMTRVSTNVNGTQARTELWYLLNPTNLTTNVVVSFSTAQSGITVGAMFYTNVNQTAPFTATNGATGATAGITNIIASSTTNLVFNVTAQRTSTGMTVTGPTQTSQWSFTTTDPASGGSIATGAASVTNSWMGIGGSPEWSSLAVSINSAPGGGGGSGPATNTTTFVQTPSFCLPFTIRSNSTIAITNYIALTNGSFGPTPAVSATLVVGSSNILTVASASYNSTNNTLVWQGTLTTNFTVASGSAVSYVISNGVSGTAFHVNYDSSNAPSKIILPTTTIINIDSLGIYDAPYPAGALVTSPTAGTTYYLRAAVSDPFGSSDITSLGVVVDGPGISGDASVTLTNAVLDTGCSKTFEYTWATINNPGAYTFTCTANEGTEGITNTAATSTTLNVLDLGTPSTATFINGTTPTNAYPANFGTACVSISDLDQNLTNAAAENVTVTISSSAGDSQSLTLTETTTNSGIFTGCLNTSTNSTAITNTTQLYAPAGSILTVSYTDPTDSSDTSSATATILTAPGVPGMTVTKSVVSPASGPVGVGSQVTFNVLVQNSGSTILTNVSVRDNYPSNALSYATASLAPTSTNLGVLNWTNLGNLAVGGSTNFTVTFNATNAAVTTNSATGTSTAVTNTSSVPFTVSRSAVTVTKTLVTPTNGPVNITSNITFRITVQNTGSTTLTNVPLADSYSATIFTNVSSTRPVDGSGAGSLLWTNVGPLASNATVTIDVTLKVTGAASPANNTATADFVFDQFGSSVPPSTSSTGLVTVAAGISGKVYNDIDQSGTLTTNDTTLSSVSLALYSDPNGDGDPADGSLVQLTTSDSVGYYELLNLTTGRYVVVETDLAGYASTFPANNRLALSLTNFVTSTNNNFFDYQPNSTNYASFSGFVWNDLNSNGTNDVTEVGLSNVVVDLVQDVNTNGVVDTGEPVVASTTTGTNGSYSFTGVIPGQYVLREVDPSGYYSTADSVGANDNFIARTATAGSSSTNNSFYDHFNLPPVAVNDTNSTSVNVAVTLDPRVNDSDPDPTNTLSVISVSATNGVAVINGGTNVTFTPTTNFNGLATIGYTISDGKGGTATATIFITVIASADVSIAKSGASSVTASQNLSYTITVTNAGPSIATNVVASDSLPAGTTFVSATGGGTTNAGTVTWSLATLAVGGSTNYTLVVTTPAFGTTLTNIASVTNATPEPTLTNNTTPPVITTVNPSADVSVTKSAAGSVNASQNLTYTITITNAGPSTATNAVASDTLPLGVTFVSATGSGTNNSGTVTWPATNLATGGSSTYTLIVTAPAFGVTLTNFAAVTNSTPDPTPTNNITPPVTTTVNPLADLSITKSGTNSVTAGQSLTYTITVTNAGPSTATNVVASDTLPVGVTFSSASGGGTTNAGTVTWSVATLASGTSTNFSLVVIAPTVGASLTNVASVTNSTPEPTLTNNTTPPVITTVNPSADVSITKTGNGTVTAGASLTYTIVVTNAGPSIATNVIARDTLPSNGIFVSATGGGTTNAGIVTWPTIATLASGASTNYTVTVLAPPTGTLTNTANVTNSTPEPTLTNNLTPPVITAVGASADLSITKSAASSVTAGQNLTYTITVTNAGPSVATNVVPSDTLPAGVTYVSATSGGTTNAGVVTWPTIATLASGASTNYTLIVTAPTTGVTLTNFASVTNSTPEPTLTNNTTPPVITTVNPLADVSITKSGASSVTAGQNLTYTITVTNAGPSTATNVIPSDVLPAGTTFFSASSGGTNNSGTVVWPATNLATGTSASYSLVVTAPTFGATLTNIATVTNSTPEPTLTNNTTPPVITTVNPSADVAVSKSGPASITAAQNITYTITVTNAGPSTATNVIASDTLPATGTFVSASGGGTTNAGVVTWPTIATLASGSSTNFTVVVTAPASGSVTNFASVTNSTPEPTLTNNVTPPVVTTVGESADVSISKSANGSVTAGQNLAYTITVTNAGPSTATNVVATDTLPTGVTFFSATGGGTNSSGTVTWPSTTLTNRGSITYTLVVTAPTTGVTLTNFAGVTTPTPDPTPTNNTTPPVITTVNPFADVSVTKGGASTVTAAQNLTYTIGVTNAGPSTATNVVTTDALPTGTTFVSATGGGITNAGTVTWTLATLASGATTNYTLIVTAPATGTLTNFASITNSTPDPTPTNNTTPPVITTVIESADVSVLKSAPGSVTAGQNLTYTITVTNAGPSLATNIVASDTLPAGTTLFSVSGAGTNSSGTILWSVASLASGVSTNFTLVVTAPPTGTLTNFASVTNSTPDPTPTNNLTPPVITTIGESADLGVTKSGPAGVALGTSFSYTIAVTNAGPSTATNVSVSDTLPAGLVFVSASPAASTNGSLVTWSLGSLAANAATNLTLTVNSTTRTTVTNFATGSSPTSDPNPTNNLGGPVVTSITNRPPVANPDSTNTLKNVTVVINPLPNDTDPDGDTLTITNVVSTNGVVTFTGTNVTFTPSTNFTGSAVITYDITDGNGGSATGSITVSIANQPPGAVNDTYSTPKNVAITVDPRTNDSDPDNDPISIASVTTTNGTVVFTGTNFVFTPTTNFVGTATVTYTVTDGFGGSSTATVTISIANQPPTAVDDSYGTPKNVAITIDPRTNDSDPDNDPLSITAVSPTNGTAVIQGGTNILFTPTTNFIGTATIGYTITDGLAFTNALITINVTNRPPVAVDDADGTTKNVAITLTPLGNDSDPDGDAFAITNASTTNGVVSFTGTNILFTPATNFTGNAVVVYTIDDGHGGTASALIVVTISDHPPIAVNDNYTTAKSVAITVDPRINDSDPNGDPLTVTNVVSTNGVAVINGGTNVTFTPSTNFVGVVNVVYTITDGFGGLDTALMIINVTNRPPTAVNDSYSTPKSVAIAVAPRGNDSDPDGDVLTIVSVSTTNGTASIVGGTNVLFTPATNFIGTVNLPYCVTDGFGATNCAVITVSITNRPPAAVNDSYSTPKSVAIAVNPRSNDSDPDGDPLTIVSVSTTNGTASIVGGTNILFTPATNFIGAVALPYCITDGFGATNCATITVSVTNRPPTAVDDSYSTPKSVAITVNPRTNDTDPDGDPLTIVSVSTTNGTVSIGGGTNILFTPATNFTGSATLPYCVTDGFGATNCATITVSITNRPPTAVNDGTNTVPNVPVTVRPLGNDTDPDGDPLTIISVSPTNGTASIIGGTNVLFTPTTNFQGTATIGYTIIDGFGGTNSALITVSVSGHPPVAVNDTNSTPRNTAVTIRPLTNDTDVDLDPLTIISVSPTNGTASIIGGTNVLFTPATNFQGTATIGYTISDGFYTTNATIFVLVTNRPPVAVNDVTTGFAFVNKSVSVLTNDSDPDGDTLILVSVTTTNGTASVSGNNVSFTPTKTSGNNYAVYTISDGHGGTNTALVIISINNSAPVAVNDTYSIGRNNPFTFNPRSNDSDANGDPLTITSVTATNGTAVIVGGTNVTYTPVSNFVGTVFLPYTITDGAASSSALITINITNRPPVAVNDTNNFTTANTPITIAPRLNDSDPDGDPLTVVSVTPTNGTASIVGGTNVLFTPATNFTGLATIGYKISDGKGGTNGAIIYVNVNPGTTASADVAVFMTGPTNVIVGNAITYSITVTNMGPNPATNVVLVDTLPGGTYYVSTSPTGAVVSGQVTWPTVPVLPVGGSTNYTLTLYTTNLGYITNVARATAVTPDPNLPNNTGELPESQARTLVNPFAYAYGATNVFNPQTGLYEETVTVTNTGGTAVAAMRVYATGLPGTVILQNSIGTNATGPYVQYNGGLAPGEHVTFLLEFLSIDRRPFTNGIVIEGTLPYFGSTNSGTFVTNITIFSETYPGTLTPHQVVEFGTIPSRIYTILYSDDAMATWQVATPTVTATANVVQWIDSGPPKTITKPSNRFYRIIQSP